MFICYFNDFLDMVFDVYYKIHLNKNLYLQDKCHIILSDHEKVLNPKNYKF